MNNFEKLGIDPPVLKIIEKEGLVEPTEIQTKAIPLGLQGKDIVAMSATGSGKTLVFAAILTHNLKKEPGVQAVILTPTRELTEQVAKMVRVFTRSKKLEVVEIIGGVAISPQIEKLRSADIVVGTPGRVLDHIGRKTLKLNTVKIFILDEADRMFDMGFIHDVNEIMGYCPYEKQMMLFSATINNEVMELSEKYMKKPVTVSVQNFVDPSKLKQVFYQIERRKKLSLLVHLVKTEKQGLVMIFCNSRRTVDFVTKNLSANGIEAHALHGGMPQNKRSKVISDFHSRTVHALVCTDVAARGLDIKNVQHIYNYNIPRDPTDYIHRIGRTARAGEEGKAISLLSEEEHSEFRRVLGLTHTKMQELDAPQVQKASVARLEPRAPAGAARRGYSTAKKETRRRPRRASWGHASYSHSSERRTGPRKR